MSEKVPQYTQHTRQIKERRKNESEGSVMYVAEGLVWIWKGESEERAERLEITFELHAS